MKRGWGLQMRSAVRHPAWCCNTSLSTLRAREPATARMCTGPASLLPRYSTTYSGCPSRPMRLLLRPATTGLLPAVMGCADVRQRGFWQGRRKESAEEREEREERERSQPKRKGLMERITGTSDKSVSTVYTAIVTNALVTTVKFGAFLATGSASMLSESVHSLGDSLNQVLLAIGIRRSQQKPDRRHPYGYGRERFVWSLISAVGVFFLGSGVTVYHGISSLIVPPELADLPIAFGVLGISFVLEGGTLFMAFRAVRDGAKETGMSIKEYILDGPDPMSVAVLVEDSIANSGAGATFTDICVAQVTGVCVAGLALGFTHYTGSALFDACGSIMIGGLMGTAALFLIEKNRRLLLGTSVPKKKRISMIKVDSRLSPYTIVALRQFLEADPTILAVHDAKGEIFSPGNMRFKAEIEFDGRQIARRYIDKNYPNIGELHETVQTPAQLEELLVTYGNGMVQHLGDEVDRIETELRRRFPSAKHIDLETD
ncbi:cation efflux family superfamily protein [Acanthamoeba castellanii str. Neff]|uniref:Cation efflux family superfamily protein n=1 Tax=Acanthamoeba castellanii (strain ATCC 30010 / Neff) TaxID=1257118 RepID=L8GLV1_ACACF|nr:cation efflux family superfamily protein [Acanthamoeba castellanii str. Neff]ELR14045.1 cation efflux family superfamily protein [Acanthamoeba castellanii str. Neff]